MSNNDFILDSIRWSYSSVNTYDTCPQAFRYRYIDALPGVGNAFSAWGTYMHSLLEKYFRGDLELFEMVAEYKKGYEDAITTEFPPNNYCDLGDRYYEAGLQYLSNFTDPFESFEVIAVEEKVKIDIERFPFVGVIDLVLKKDDEYYIVDHKSKSKFKSKAEQTAYFRQLYLYALYIHRTYGKWPKQLIFNMVRADILLAVDFDKREADKAKEWFVGTIRDIYFDDEFISKPNSIRNSIDILKKELREGHIPQPVYVDAKKKLDRELKDMAFYCEELCGCRDVCPLKDQAHSTRG